MFVPCASANSRRLLPIVRTAEFPCAPRRQSSRRGFCLGACNLLIPSYHRIEGSAAGGGIRLTTRASRMATLFPAGATDRIRGLGIQEGLRAATQVIRRSCSMGVETQRRFSRGRDRFLPTGWSWRRKGAGIPRHFSAGLSGQNIGLVEGHRLGAQEMKSLPYRDFVSGDSKSVRSCGTNAERGNSSGVIEGPRPE